MPSNTTSIAGEMSSSDGESDISEGGEDEDLYTNRPGVSYTVQFGIEPSGERRFRLHHGSG